MKHLKLFETFDVTKDEQAEDKVRRMSIHALAGKPEYVVLYLKSKPSTDELHKDLKSLDIDFADINAKKKAQHYTVGNSKAEFNLYANGPSIVVETTTTYVPSEKIVDKLKSKGWMVVASKRDRGTFIGGYSVVYMQKGEFMLYTNIGDDDDTTSIITLAEIVKE